MLLAALETINSDGKGPIKFITHFIGSEHSLQVLRQQIELSFPSQNANNSPARSIVKCYVSN